jgi:hypothetical protein
VTALTVEEFKPFPPGTIRGPYFTSRRSEKHVQFMVQTKNGWVPFVRDARYEAECRQSAETFAAKLLP